MKPLLEANIVSNCTWKLDVVEVLTVQCSRVLVKSVKYNLYHSKRAHESVKWSKTDICQERLRTFKTFLRQCPSSVFMCVAIQAAQTEKER